MLRVRTPAHLHPHDFALTDVWHLMLPRRHNQLAQAWESKSKCAVPGCLDETADAKEVVTNVEIFT
jgi:hypothetical protein